MKVRATATPSPEKMTIRDSVMMSLRSSLTTTHTTSNQRVTSRLTPMAAEQTVPGDSRKLHTGDIQWIMQTMTTPQILPYASCNVRSDKTIAPML